MSDISVNLEFTPNPNTLKFLVNRGLLPQGAANFTDRTAASRSPLAQKLFEVRGVKAVLLGTNFVTITKSDEGSWDLLADEIPKIIETHLSSNLPVVDADWSFETKPGNDSEVERKIRHVLDSEIRPAVAMDGGDITFVKYEDGIVYLQLQGSCSSCPSSAMTLKIGVENRLKEVIPEIKEVVQV